MTIRRLPSVVGCLIAMVATAASAQEMDQLRARADAGLESARLATRASLEAMAGYPKDVRDAILTLSVHPDLVVKLGWAGGAGLDSALANYPGEVQAAAKLLAGKGEWLKVLADRLPVVTLIGQSVGDQLPAVRQILDREADRRGKMSSAVVDAWRRRVTAKPMIAQQLATAASDFATAQNSLQPLTPGAQPVADVTKVPVPESNPDSGLDWTAAVTRRVVRPLPMDPMGGSSGFGVAPGATPVVNGLPGPDEAYFVLAHADRHPELAAAVVDQWYFEPNPEGFRAAVDHWYTNYQETLPGNLGILGDQLPAVLKERMVLEQRFLAAIKEAAGARIVRADFLEAHGKDFPALIHVRDAEIIARLSNVTQPVRGGPVSKSTSGSGGRSSSSSSSGSSGRSTSNRTGGRSSSRALGDSGSQANSSRSRSNSGSGSSRFGNNSGNSNSRFGGSGSSGFGSDGSGFGSGGSGFGSGGSGFASGSSGFGSGSSGFGSGNSGGSRFGSNSR